MRVRVNKTWAHSSSTGVDLVGIFRHDDFIRFSNGGDAVALNQDRSPFDHTVVAHGENTGIRDSDTPLWFCVLGLKTNGDFAGSRLFRIDLASVQVWTQTPVHFVAVAREVNEVAASVLTRLIGRPFASGPTVMADPDCTNGATWTWKRSTKAIAFSSAEIWKSVAHALV